jgi:hypothetical protein
MTFLPSSMFWREDTPDTGESPDTVGNSRDLKTMSNVPAAAAKAAGG